MLDSVRSTLLTLRALPPLLPAQGFDKDNSNFYNRWVSQCLGWGSYLAKLTFLSTDVPYISGTNLGWGSF